MGDGRDDSEDGTEAKGRGERERERGRGERCMAKHCERLYALYGCSGCAHANSWQRCREEEEEEGRGLEGLPYSHGIPVSKKKQTKQRAKKRTKSVNRFASLHKRPPRPSLGFSTEPDAPTPQSPTPPFYHLSRSSSSSSTSAEGKP